MYTINLQFIECDLKTVISLLGNSYPCSNTDQAKCFETFGFFSRYDEPGVKPMTVIDR